MCGSLQGHDTSHCDISSSLTLWLHCMHIEKKVERGKVSPPARERRKQKCAFLNSASPCLHHLFWSLFDFLGCPLAWPFHFTLPFISHLPCFFPFTLNFLYCPVNESCQLHITLTFTLAFTLTASTLTAQEI